VTTYKEALEQLCQRDGFLTPQQVVGEAVDPAHPLHDYFEWDDSEAASRYRLAQAGQLIRSVKITVQVSEEETRRVRAYTSVPREDRPVYVPTDTALRQERDVVMAQALRDLAALRNKYRGLVDFGTVLEAFVELEQAA
jgi:hypothetical protein